MQPTERHLDKNSFAKVSVDAFSQFLAKHHGAVIRRGDRGYEEARAIWNAMIERRPAIIARCSEVSDIQLCLEFAKAQNLLFSIRGGGHNIAGNALCDDGLTIDLSQLRNVNVDPIGLRAHVEPGATLADLDRATQKFGLATPTGINSTTGVAGLTLGGGFGWLTRLHGLTVDNLISVEILLADGRLVYANEQRNSDLFWAVRGGGGNFGVVTDFEFRLHSVGPEVLSGLVVFPLEQAQTVLRNYRDFVSQMPDELNIWAVLRKAPPLPFLDSKHHGKEVLILAVFYAGTEEKGRALIEPVTQFGTPLGQHIDLQPYTSWQKTFDPLLTFGARNYWKSHNFSALTDDAIRVAADFAHRLPSSSTEIFFGSLGGAAGRVPIEATAYPHRDSLYTMNVHGRWTEPSQDSACVKWVRELYRAMEPFATGGVYVNFLTQDEPERIRSAYGRSYARLSEIKAKYDPENLFRVNQNIQPTAPSSSH
jgi:FAD/FMN-containing dehydrogenase